MNLYEIVQIDDAELEEVLNNKEAIQDSKSSLNPINLEKRAKEYLFDLSIKSNT